MATKEKNPLVMLKLLKIACALGEGEHKFFDDSHVNVDKRGNVFITGMSLDEALKQIENPECSRCGLKYRRRIDSSVCGECKGKE